MVSTPANLLSAVVDGQVDVNHLRMVAVYEADVLMASTKLDGETTDAGLVREALMAFPQHVKRQLIMTMTSEDAELDFAHAMSKEHYARADKARQTNASCCGGGTC